MRLRLVLASQSPARLKLLRAAGFAPEVIVSGVDEDGFEAASPAELVLMLAQAKARAVAERIAAQEDEDGDEDKAGTRTLVIGCDSVLDVDGSAYSKPGTAQAATMRWKEIRGREGVLFTGHCLIDLGSGREVADIAPTLVRFSDITDEEIDAYVATGEPLQVAGAFTIDGIGGSFVDSIAGDASNVVGLSLPLLRRLLGGFGYTVPQLWAADIRSED
ncbi:MAG TPA: nucleoside triphosphate pyrophosphatase [Actinocrinis sp.]